MGFQNGFDPDDEEQQGAPNKPAQPGQQPAVTPPPPPTSAAPNPQIPQTADTNLEAAPPPTLPAASETSDVVEEDAAPDGSEATRSITPRAGRVGKVKASSLLGDESQQPDESYADWQQRRQAEGDAGLLGPIRPRYSNPQVQAAATAQEQAGANAAATGIAQQEAAEQNEQHAQEAAAAAQAAKQQAGTQKAMAAAQRTQTAAWKDQGIVLSHQPDGTIIPQTRDDGSTVYEPKTYEPFQWGEDEGGDGKYYRDYRDDRGVMHRQDILADHAYHTDPETGQTYLDIKGMRQPIGVDQNIVQVNALKQQQDDLALRDAQDDADLQQKKIDLQPLKQQLEEASKTLNPKKSESDFELAKANYAPGGQAEDPDLWKSAQQQHANFLAKWGPLKQAVEQQETDIRALESQRLDSAKQKAQLLSNVRAFQLARRTGGIPGGSGAGTGDDNALGTGPMGAGAPPQPGTVTTQTDDTGKPASSVIADGPKATATPQSPVDTSAPADGKGSPAQSGAPASSSSSSSAPDSGQKFYRIAAGNVVKVDADHFSDGVKQAVQDGILTKESGSKLVSAQIDALSKQADNGVGEANNALGMFVHSFMASSGEGFAGMARWVGLKGMANFLDKGVKAHELALEGTSYADAIKQTGGTAIQVGPGRSDKPSVNPGMADDPGSVIGKVGGDMAAMIPSMAATEGLGALSKVGAVARVFEALKAPALATTLGGKLIGQIPMAVQIAAQGADQARTQALRQGRSEVQADAAGFQAAEETLPGTFLYGAMGEATGAVMGKVGKVLPVMQTPFRRAVATGALTAAGNVAASTGLRVAEGGKAGDFTAGGVAQDVAWAVLAAKHGAEAAKYIPTARALDTGDHPELQLLRSMQQSQTLPQAVRDTAGKQADALQADARSFLTAMGEKPSVTPGQQTRDAYTAAVQRRQAIQDELSAPVFTPEEIKAVAQRKIASLEAFQSPDPANPAKVGILSDDDRETLAFLKQNADNPTAIAQRYGLKTDRQYTPDDLAAADNHLHNFAQGVLQTTPAQAAAGLKAAGLTSGTEEEAHPVLTELNRNPVLARGSLLVGNMLRGSIPVDEAQTAMDDGNTVPAVSKARADQLIGAHAIIDSLPKIVRGEPVDPSIAAALERTGMIRTVTASDGSQGYTLTEDGIPFLPERARKAVGYDPQRFNVQVSPNPQQPAGQVAGALEDAGEQRITGVMDSLGDDFNHPQWDVRVKYKGGSEGSANTGGVGEGRLSVRAPDEMTARHVAERHFVDAGREVTESSAEQTRGGRDLDEGEAKRVFSGSMKHYAEDLRKLGIKGVEVVGDDDPRTPGGIAMGADRVLVSWKRLARQLSGDLEGDATAQDLMHETMAEEVVHALAQDALTPEELAEVGRSAEAGITRAARKIYNGWDNLDDRLKGHEILRMVMTGKWRGTVTEAIYKAVKKVAAYLTKRFSVLPEDSPLKKYAAKVEARAQELGISLAKQSAGEHEVETPTGEMKAKVAWRVHPLADLITSDKPEYRDELQPRIRSRKASQNQVHTIAHNLNPERLGESKTSDLGAPIVNPERNVLSGNGRVQALRIAYGEGGKRAADYRAFVAREAARQGLDIAGMKNPVLVRETRGLSGPEETEFTKQSNKQQVLGMSEVEQAREDASMIADNKLFDIFKPGENGEILTAANRDFNRLFVSAAGDDARLLRADGSFAPELEGRVKRAVLASLLKGEDPEVITNAVERAPKVGLARAVNGIMAGSGKLLALRESHPKMDISGDLATALRNAIEARGLIESGKAKNAEDALAQGHLLERPSEAAQLLTRELLEAGSAKAVRDFLGEYSRIVGNMAKGQSMFGDEEEIKPAELLRSLLDQAKLEKQRVEAARGLKSAIAAAARSPRQVLEETFGKDFKADEYGMPLPPHPLPAGHPLLQPTHGKAEAEMSADDTLVARKILPMGTVSRNQLHGAIIKYLAAGAQPLEPGEQPRAFLLGGGGGAGKTTIAEALRAAGVPDIGKALKINVDDIKTLLPEYRALVRAGDARAANVTHEESSQLASRMQSIFTDPARQRKYHVLIDSTMANGAKSRAMIADLKARGFSPALIGVTIDPEAALARAFARGKESGRWVPSEVLAAAHRGFNGAVKSYLPLVDEAYLWDNTPPEPRQIATKTGGRVDIQDANSYGEIDERAHFQAQSQSGADPGRGDGGDAGPDARLRAAPERGGQGDRDTAVRPPEAPGDTPEARAAGGLEPPPAAAERRKEAEAQRPAFLDETRRAAGRSGLRFASEEPPADSGPEDLLRGTVTSPAKDAEALRNQAYKFIQNMAKEGFRLESKGGAAAVSDDALRFIKQEPGKADPVAKEIRVVTPDLANRKGVLDSAVFTDKVRAFVAASAESQLPPAAMVDDQAHEAATSPHNDLPEPTPAQAEAGNYQKGHVNIGGLDISIEHPAGSKRDPAWPALASHYGYIRGTVGRDKDHLDVFIRPGTPEDWRGPVFVVNQKHGVGGRFDEHKAILGADGEADAVGEYLKNYQAPWAQNVHSMAEMSFDEFKRWAREGDKSGPARAHGEEHETPAVAAAARQTEGGEKNGRTTNTEEKKEGRAEAPEDQRGNLGRGGPGDAARDAGNGLADDGRNGRRPDVGLKPAPGVKELITDNLGLAHHIANRYHIPGIEPEDVAAEARVGLAKAALNYDAARGSFASFAGRVIRNHLHDVYRQEKGRVANESVTLDDLVHGEEGEDGVTHKDNVPDMATPGAPDATARAETARIVRAEVAKFPANVQRILEQRMNGKTFEEIGDDPSVFGRKVPKQTVQLVAKKALDLIRTRLAEAGYKGVDSDGAIMAAVRDPDKPETGREPARPRDVDRLRDLLNADREGKRMDREDADGVAPKAAEEQAKKDTIISAEDRLAKALGTKREPVKPSGKETDLLGSLDDLEGKIGKVEAVKESVRNTGNLVKRMLDEVTNLPPDDPYKRAVNRYTAKLQSSEIEVVDAVKNLEKKVPDKLTREAITNYRVASGDEGKLRMWAELSQDPKLKAGYEKALALTDDQKEMAAALDAYYKSKLALGQDRGMLEHGVESYATQIWRDAKGKKLENSPFEDVERDKATGEPLKDEEGNFIHKIGSKFQQGFDFANPRTFDDFFTGESMGYRPLTKDAASLLGIYGSEFNRTLALRELVQELATTKAEDGRNIVGAEGHPQTLRAVREDEPADLETGAFHIERPEDSVGYKQVDHRVFQNWKFTTPKEQVPKPEQTQEELALADDRAPKPTPVVATLKAGSLVVHPDYARRFNNLVGDSAIRQWSHSSGPALEEIPKGILRGIDWTNKQVKALTFAGSPFHVVHLAKRAAAYGINPFTDLDRVDPENPLHRRALLAGLMVAPDQHGINRWMEGLGNVDGTWAAKIPVAKQMSEWLFHEYIPKLKMKGWVSLTDRMLNGQFKEDVDAGRISSYQVENYAARIINNAFGHLNIGEMGGLMGNPTVRHVMSMAMLAPDFTQSTMQHLMDAGKGLIPGSQLGRQSMKSIAALALGVGFVAKTLNKLIDGKWHFDHPFSLVVGNREYSLRSQVTDIQHLFSDPRAFMFGRISPLARTLVELATMKNYRGEQVSYTDQAREFGASWLPSVLRALPPFNQLSPTDAMRNVKPLEQLSSALGLRVSRWSASKEVNGWADDFLKSKGKENTVTYPTSKFTPLKNALSDNDLLGAKEEYAKLMAAAKTEMLAKAKAGFLKGIEPPAKMVEKSMRSSTFHPVIGDPVLQQEFLRSLSPYQREMFKESIKERMDVWKRFQGISGSVAPPILPKVPLPSEDQTSAIAAPPSPARRRLVGEVA